MKTRKSITKRLKLTKKGKLVRRKAGQNHFNARATGNQTRKKHGSQNINERDVKKMVRAIN